MRKISNFFLRGCHHQFQFCGEPARFRGVGHHITASCLSTASNSRMEPMYIHCLPGYVSTLFLIEYPERSEFLLLDCGSPSDVHRVRYYMERVLFSSPLKLNEHLKLATISHSHIDHSGGAGQLYEEGIPVAWPSCMEGAYDGLCGRIHQLVESMVILYMGLRMGRRVLENPFSSAVSFFGPYWRFPPPLSISVSTSSSSFSPLSDPQEDRDYLTRQSLIGQGSSSKQCGTGRSLVGGGTLKDMDCLPAGFLDWRVVQLSGHVSHMVGFYHFFSRTFYVADLFVQLKGRYFPPFRIDFPDAYRETLLRVRSLDVRCILLPHGGIVNLTNTSTTPFTGGKVRSTVNDKIRSESISWKHIVDQVLHNFEQIHTHQVRNPLTTRVSKMGWVGNLMHLLDHVVCVKRRTPTDPLLFKKLFTSSFYIEEPSQVVLPPIRLFSLEKRAERKQSNRQTKKQ